MSFTYNANKTGDKTPPCLTADAAHQLDCTMSNSILSHPITRQLHSHYTIIYPGLIVTS